MADERIRRLERGAAQGDHKATEQLWRERERAGLPPVLRLIFDGNSGGRQIEMTLFRFEADLVQALKVVNITAEFPSSGAVELEPGVYMIGAQHPGDSTRLKGCDKFEVLARGGTLTVELEERTGDLLSDSVEVTDQIEVELTSAPIGDDEDG